MWNRQRIAPLTTRSWSGTPDNIVKLVRTDTRLRESVRVMATLRRQLELGDGTITDEERAQAINAIDDEPRRRAEYDKTTSELRSQIDGVVDGLASIRRMLEEISTQTEGVRGVQAFVIEFNRRTRDRRVHQFASSREAVAYRLKLERERHDSDVEIAALTSGSLDSLKRTHSRYFTGADISSSLSA